MEYIAKKGKPILLSTGASDEGEVARAVDAIRRHNACDLALLHCVLEYPTPYEHANLLKIKSLADRFPDCLIGYSDHTKPDETMEVITSAYVLGARIIEKHFTLDKTLKGNDHYHAMDPSDARKIIRRLEFANTILGSGELRCLPTEQSARLNARRSIVVNQDIDKGETITREMLTFKRPGTGISPTDIDLVVGRKAAVKLTHDTLLTDSVLE
jgi:N-acetylneuraminate synthase